MEFHLELSWEDRFQFSHVLLAKGDPFVLMYAIEQRRHVARVSDSLKLPMTALDCTAPASAPGSVEVM